jgi:hypothetical protein
MRRWRRSLAVVAMPVALVVAAVAPPAAGSDPAGAAHTPYYFDRTVPVGWVDGDGPHQAVVREKYQVDEAWLRIESDAGPLIEVDLETPDPAGDGNQDFTVASDGAGSLVVAVRGDETPVLWMTRFGPDGSQLAPTVVIDEDELPWRPLPDGSILTSVGTYEGEVVWRAADGTERARLGALRPDVGGVALDADGRLLVPTDDGTVRRWTDAGAVDLTVPNSCDATGGFAVAADPEGGFVTACGTSEGPMTMDLVRYDDAGEEEWSVTTEDEQFGIVEPRSGWIDGSGRVWLVGTACAVLSDSPPPGRCPYAFQLLRAHGPDGATDDPHEMRSVDLRSIDIPAVEPRPDGDDLVWAASSPPDVNLKGDWYDGSSYSFRTPEPGGPPTCKPATAEIDEVAAGAVTVRFPEGCGRVSPVNADYGPAAYRVEALGPGLTVAGSVDVPTGDGIGTSTGTVTGLPGGVRYRFQVRAVNASGSGPPSPATISMTPPFTDLAEFVRRQHLDLAGRQVPLDELEDTVFALHFESITPAGVVDQLLGRPWSGPSVDPVTRLYRAYFGRNPDSSGLRHWAAARRRGRAITAISSAFAASNEFRTRYGSLSNREFVKRVYLNVLGRPGDPGGVDYWTRQLDLRRRSRGQVMLGFSESTEFQRRSKPNVDLVAVTFGLLDRAPTAAEVSTWAPLLTAGAPRTDVISSVLGGAEYASRVVPA